MSQENKNQLSLKGAMNFGLILAVIIHVWLNIYAFWTVDSFLMKAVPVSTVLTAVALWVLFRVVGDKH